MKIRIINRNYIISLKKEREVLKKNSPAIILREYEQMKDRTKLIVQYMFTMLSTTK